MRVIGVYREDVYSPGKVTQDASILDSALRELSRRGCRCSAVRTEELSDGLPPADLVLSMAQSDSVLRREEEWERKGLAVMNSPGSVRNCYRKPLIELLSRGGMPLPQGRIVSLEELRCRLPVGSSGGFCWLKRGDVHAVAAGDVAMVRSGEDLEKALDHFTRNDIREILVQEHVEGRTVKFYAVGNDYFRAFLSTSGEEITGQVPGLKEVAWECAGVLGLEIYGGDAILTDSGGIAIVDLNDWPSFSSCCSSAAEAIALRVLRFLPRAADGSPSAPGTSFGNRVSDQ